MAVNDKELNKNDFRQQRQKRHIGTVIRIPQIPFLIRFICSIFREILHWRITSMTLTSNIQTWQILT